MRRLLALAALLTLCVARPAAAAKAPAKATAAPAPAPAAAPAAPAPADPPASGATAASFDPKNLSIAAYLGGEFGDVTTFALRADASLPIMPLTPKIKLHGVASLGFGTGGQDIPFGTTDWNIVTLIPAARAQLNAAPQLDLYGDVGLGLYWGFWDTTTTITMPFIGTTTTKASGSSVGVLMRFAVGGLYEVSPQLKIAAELGLNPYFGDASTTNFIALVGAQYKL